MAQGSELLDETKEILDKQNTLCKSLIAEKNNLINELNSEIKAKDEHYVRELKKRTEDIDLLAERMESQIKVMQRTYRDEITAIENAFLDQREKLIAEQNEEWELLMHEIKQKQINYLKQTEEQAIENEKEFYDLRTKYSEEFNELKLTLDAEVETFENQLQKLKPIHHLNIEKLNYNYEILKRRDEENTILKSNQKRRITRLQSRLNNLRRKSTKQEQQFSTENEQISKDYKGRMENYSDIQKKFKSMIGSVQKSFHDIWIMNEQNLKKLSHRLLEAHRVITEQQLGLTWNPPDVSFMENVGPLKQATSKPPAVIAMELALQPDQKPILNSQNEILENNNTTIPTRLREVAPKTVLEFLHLLCYEPEFLIDKDMKSILDSLGYEEQLLLRLDTILNALGVQNEEDLNLLFTYFIQQSKDDESQLQRLPLKSESIEKSSSNYTCLQSLQKLSDKLMKTVKFEPDDGNKVQSTIDKKCSIKTEHVTDQSDDESKTDESSISHEPPKKYTLQWNLISPNHVIEAIYEFTEDLRQQRQSSNDHDTDRVKTSKEPDIIPLKDKLKNNLQSIKTNESCSLNKKETKQPFDLNKIDIFFEDSIRDDSQDLAYWNKYQ
ncbi:unnamed protein product [Schistosoma turkestanicum]|nr:unnamed protein product [Schistosoma turkestanicum]